MGDKCQRKGDLVSAQQSVPCIHKDLSRHIEQFQIDWQVVCGSHFIVRKSVAVRIGEPMIADVATQLLEKFPKYHSVAIDTN